MRKTLLFAKYACLLLGLGLAGCINSVYRPMQCAAPALNGPGQLEATVSAYVNPRWNAALNYAPGRHWLVRAAYDRRASRPATDSSHLRSWQYELAAGTYWPLGRQRQLVLGALAGVGQARFQARYRDQFANNALSAYDARSNKGFGELYATWQLDPPLQVVAAYRLTGIRFTDLAGPAQPLLARNTLRGELLVAARFTVGYRAGQPPLGYVQLGAGGSEVLRGWSGQLGRPDAYSSEGNTYLTVGIGLFPAAIRQRFR